MSVNHHQIIADSAKIIDDAHKIAAISQRIMEESYNILRSSQALLENEMEGSEKAPEIDADATQRESPYSNLGKPRRPTTKN